jgi:hypothetical protein
MVWEWHYYGTGAEFYINMLTHFMGGVFTALGVLIIRDTINWVCVQFPTMRALQIPRLPLLGLVFIVLVVGLVWEGWEVVFKDNDFYTIDTMKDVIMDVCGAAFVSIIAGKKQHD